MTYRKRPNILTIDNLELIDNSIAINLKQK